MKRAKGFSLIELMIVISIINVLASVAIVMFSDYTKKARVAEAPPILKAIAKSMIEYNADEGNDGYPSNISELGFVTNNKTTFGTFFEYRVNPQVDCNPQDLSKFAYAIAIIKTDLPTDYQYACVNPQFDLYHGSEASGDDSGDSGNSGNSGDSGNTGDSGDSGDSGNSGNTGNTGGPGEGGGGGGCGILYPVS